MNSNGAGSCGWLPESLWVGGSQNPFDVDTVANRSLIAHWIRECRTVPECYSAFFVGRDQLGDQLRDIENFPRHEEIRG